MARRLHRGRASREYGEEVGSRLARTYATRSPRPTRRTSRRAPARVDLGRLEAHPGEAGTRPVALPAARRGPRRGAAQGLPGRRAALAVRGAADAVVDGRRGRRRAALRARRPATGASYIYDFGLRYAPAACPTGCRELFQDALRAVWDGLQRDRRLQRAGARGRPDLAAGHGAARLREVHAAGRHARSRSGLHRGGAARQRRHHPAAGAAVRGALRPGPQRRLAADAEARRAQIERDRGPDRRGPSTTWPASTTTGSCAPT